jgi:hypothetical protein
MLAAEAWLRAGDLEAARRSMARARERGPLPPELARGGAVIESMIEAADSVSRARASEGMTVSGPPSDSLRGRGPRP